MILLLLFKELPYVYAIGKYCTLYYFRRNIRFFYILIKLYYKFFMCKFFFIHIVEILRNEILGIS